MVLAGYWPSFVAGRIGRREKPPPQFGHTLASTCSTQSAQNVHSNVQIIASVELGGKGLSQFSQVGRSSSMGLIFSVRLRGRNDTSPNVPAMSATTASSSSMAAAIATGLYTVPMDSDAGDHSEPVPVASFATEGEAEVVQAKLRAFGIEAAVDDLIEGGAIPVEGEATVVVAVRAADADDARRILADDDVSPGEPPIEP